MKELIFGRRAGDARRFTMFLFCVLPELARINSSMRYEDSFKFLFSQSLKLLSSLDPAADSDILERSQAAQDNAAILRETDRLRQYWITDLFKNPLSTCHDVVFPVIRLDMKINRNRCWAVGYQDLQFICDVIRTISPF